jgi:hypothetical protein
MLAEYARLAFGAGRRVALGHHQGQHARLGENAAWSHVQEFLQMDFSGKPMKYETTLQRRLFTVLYELRYLQEHRPGEDKDQGAAPSNAETPTPSLCQKSRWRPCLKR